MRRLLRRLLNGLGKALCLLSLLACLGVARLWWHSYRTRAGGEDHAGAFLRWRQARYTIRSSRGRLTLFAPPPRPPRVPGPPTSKPEPAVDDLAGQVSDEQLDWQVARLRASDRAPSYRGNPYPGMRFGTPAEAIDVWLEHQADWRLSIDYRNRNLLTQATRAREAEVQRMQAPLLLALEEPGRALAAHAVLVELRRSADPSLPLPLPMSAANGIEPLPDGSFAQTLDGVRVVLRPREPFSAEPGLAHDVEMRSCSAGVDARQIATARDEWHRRLDVAVGSVPHWQLFVAAAVAPLLWLAARSRRLYVRRRRRRLGLCLRCGYDLRGNASGKCSECGAEVETVRQDGRVTA